MAALDKVEADVRDGVDRETIETVQAMSGAYKYGWDTDIETEYAPKGVNEDIVRLISSKNGEPEWMTEWRLAAFRRWQQMDEPRWAMLNYPVIDYQDQFYYARPKSMSGKPKSLDEVDPKLLATYAKLGIPLKEQMIALNCAVFSDGTFVYIPEGVRCPMELSTYFRINAENTGQFERTLIIAEKGAYVSYLEGCTAPMRDENQLHAAVVELVAMDDAEIKYSTVQNWYPGDAEGKGGIYNFVTKRALCQGKRSKVSWTQVETGSAVTWKYPSCVLNGEDSVGEFYSVAVTNNYQQADTGTKMIHNGKGSRSTIISKGISAGHSNNTYRGLVKVAAGADGVRNFTQCDSLLLGKLSGAHTVPYIEVRNPSATIEHEATTSKISDDQMFYAMQRGLGQEEAVALIVNGFAKEVLQQLPMEFAVEAQKLLGISLEGSVG